MSNNQATAERYEPERFLCDMSDCVDGGDSCKARMKTSIAGAFVYHSDYTQLLAEVGRLREALERASTLASLLTVRQVINAGDKYIDAAGLNPWCMNEGLATGDEQISVNFARAALRGNGEGE